MLVLTRTIGESIDLHVRGATIRVTLVDSRATRARIGIEAPNEVKVLRSELASAAKAEKRRLARFRARIRRELDS